MGEQAKLNLGIVGIEKRVALTGDKILSHLSAHFCTDWNILQVRLCAGETTRGSQSLLKVGVNSTIFVPAKDICDKMGATMNRKDDKIKLGKKNSSVELKIESDTAKVNGVKTKLNHKVFLVDNTEYVPLRVVAEAFGYSIKWDGERHAAILD